MWCSFNSIENWDRYTHSHSHTHTTMVELSGSEWAEPWVHRVSKGTGRPPAISGNNWTTTNWLVFVFVLLLLLLLVCMFVLLLVCFRYFWQTGVLFSFSFSFLCRFLYFSFSFFFYFTGVYIFIIFFSTKLKGGNLSYYSIFGEYTLSLYHYKAHSHMRGSILSEHTITLCSNLILILIWIHY